MIGSAANTQKTLGAARTPVLLVGLTAVALVLALAFALSLAN